MVYHEKRFEKINLGSNSSSPLVVTRLSAPHRDHLHYLKDRPKSHKKSRNAYFHRVRKEKQIFRDLHFFNLLKKTEMIEIL